MAEYCLNVFEENVQFRKNGRHKYTRRQGNTTITFIHITRGYNTENVI